MDGEGGTMWINFVPHRVIDQDNLIYDEVKASVS